MARDDYYVIVYQILSYLYCRLKAGESIDAKMINYDTVVFLKKYCIVFRTEVSLLNFACDNRVPDLFSYRKQTFVSFSLHSYVN